jgi:hypothetical protein
VDLDSVDACLSLHVALVALDAIRDGDAYPARERGSDASRW